MQELLLDSGYTNVISASSVQLCLIRRTLLWSCFPRRE